MDGSLPVTFVLLCGKNQLRIEDLNSNSSFKIVKEAITEKAFSQTSNGDGKQQQQQQQQQEMKLIVKGKVRKDAELIKSCLTKKDLEKVDGVVLKGKVSGPPELIQVLNLVNESNKETIKEPQQQSSTNLGDSATSSVSSSSSSSSSMSKPISSTSSTAAESKIEKPHDIPEGSLLIIVKQGKLEYFVVARSLKWTILNIKQNLQSQIAVPVEQQKIIIKGKIRKDTETLEMCGVANKSNVKEIKAMLMFSDGYHQAVDGGDYLKVATKEAEIARQLYEKIQNQAKHRVADPMDFLIQIDTTVDRLQNCLHFLKGRPVPSQMIEQKAETLKHLEELAEKLLNLKKHGFY